MINFFFPLVQLEVSRALFSHSSAALIPLEPKCLCIMFFTLDLKYFFQTVWYYCTSNWEISKRDFIFWRVQWLNCRMSYYIFLVYWVFLIPTSSFWCIPLLLSIKLYSTFLKSFNSIIWYNIPNSFFIFLHRYLIIWICFICWDYLNNKFRS